MGLLGPGEELLPDSLTAGEARINEPPAYYVPGIRDIALLGFCLALIFVLLKTWLRLAWALPGSSTFKLRKSYVAVASILHDLGYRRNSAETREEFLARMIRELQIEAPRLSAILNLLKYSSPDSVRLSAADIRQVRLQDFAALRSLPLLRRLAAFLNPASLLAFLSGGGW